MMKEIVEKNIVKWLWIVLLTPLAVFVILLLCVCAFAKIPSFEDLERPDSKLATQVLASDGRVLTTFHIENRSFVKYEELSPYLVQAAVATEDKRFYSHSGIDLWSLGRVFFKTLLKGDSSQGGGSTITQQLAKTLYPRAEMTGGFPVRHAKLVWIKLKEWVTAIKLERCYTKDEIINMYMNAIFFGSGSYGIKAAAGTFFGKDPSQLNAQEAATLVGMVNKPTRYNPALNPERSKVRRDYVLGKMTDKKYLTKAERDSICALPIELNYHVQDHNSGLAPYFRDMLRRVMNAKKPRRSSYQWDEDYRADSLLWEVDQLYGWLNKNFKADGTRYDLDKDGLRIRTTIDYTMQKYAEEAVAEHLGGNLQKAFDREIRYSSTRPFASDTPKAVIDKLMDQARRWSDRYRIMKKSGASDKEIQKSFTVPVRMKIFSWNKKGYIDTLMTPNDSIRYYKSMLRAAFMAVEPVTGEVKAYVGGPSYRWFKFDNVRQGKRQVGSTAKPFLYTLAMQEGMSPCHRVINVPQTFDVVGTEDTWTPKSTDNQEWIGQSVTLKWGLMKSSNNISAYLMKQFGPAAMAQMMHRMGISSHLDEVYSLCVGSCDLSLYELVPAYNTFPSHGVYVSPIFVTSIEDNMGNTLGSFVTRKREAISEHTAYLMENLMAGVVNGGTAYRLRGYYGLQGDMAGKTGTNNDQADGWFVGYTPKLTAGVWVGGEDRQVHFRGLALGGGSNMALPIWGIFMKKCMKDGTLGLSSSDQFSVPANFGVSLDCGEDMMDATAASHPEGGEDTNDYDFFD